MKSLFELQFFARELVRARADSSLSNYASSIIFKLKGHQSFLNIEYAYSALRFPLGNFALYTYTLADDIRQSLQRVAQSI
jgi:hypothetical protein